MPKWTLEQSEAINKSGSNIIVSAGAGSGKTAVLTERVITKLKQGIHINELLILTFTNNAAGEMKERIKKAIKKIPELQDELNLIESAYITTFDAFTLSLIKKYHYVLNINSDISIIDASIIKEKKKEIIDYLFNEYYEVNDKDFINFVTHYGVKNDKSIKKRILSLDNALDLIIDKEDYLNNYLDNYYNDEHINNLFKEYTDLIYKRIDAIKSCLYNLSFEVEGSFYEKVSLSLDALLSANNYESIRNNLDISLPRMPNGTEEKAKYYKAQISSLIKDVKELCTEPEDILLKDLKESKTEAKILIDIFKKLTKEINSYKTKYNMYEFNDISKMAIYLLKNNEFVKNNLKNSFKEIMIDEYQDTSDMQEEFISLIQNNNVYMVGDIKQSIYRFRNANPDIFKIKYDKYKKNDGGLKIDLNKNFRSRESVLNSINALFNHIMDDKIGNANYQKEHQLIFGNNDFYEFGNNNYNNNLEIYNYEKDDLHSKEEIEAFIIGNDINKKINEHYKVLDGIALRDIKYADFCILMDRTSAFNTYKKVFDFLKIPLNIYKDEDILFTDETYLLNNTLGLIINIKKNIFDENTKFYFTSIARSYLYSMEDKIIYETIMSNKIYETEIYQKCKEISQIMDSLSNQDILNLIIEKFDFYQKMISMGNVNYRTIIINNILNKAEELNKIGTDAYGMLSYFNSLIDSAEAIKIPAIISESDSVTITNIHKSKGLEYKICYFSGWHKEFNIMDLKDRILYNNKYGLIIPAYDKGFKNTFVNTLNKENYIKEEISEKIRLLYVALTRCKEKMIVVTSLDNNKIMTTDENGIIDYLERINYKSFKDILNSAYDYIKDYIVNVDVPVIDTSYKYNKDFCINDYIEETPIIEVNELEYNDDKIKEEHYSKSTNKLFSIEEKENMDYGKHIHYLLENFDFKNPNYDNLLTEEINIIKGLLNNPIMFNLASAKIYQEYEFIYETSTESKNGIIDLMLIYDDHVDIIDYKLKNTSDEAYLSQLKGYQDYIYNKTNKKTNIYLYSLLDKILVDLN